MVWVRMRKIGYKLYEPIDEVEERPKNAEIREICVVVDINGRLYVARTQAYVYGDFAFIERERFEKEML